MQSLLVTLDEPTLEALNRLAPPGERRRMKFLRDAIRRAVLTELERRARAGYRAHPDSEIEADDWSTAEEYHP
jgi:hypothetical protein